MPYKTLCYFLFICFWALSAGDRLITILGVYKEELKAANGMLDKQVNVENEGRAVYVLLTRSGNEYVANRIIINP